MTTALQLIEPGRALGSERAPQQAQALQLRSLEDLQTLGQVFVKSGFFGDTKDAAQAMVKVMAGAELGFPPITAMTGIYIVKGRVSLSANLMAAAIKRSGKYNFRVLEIGSEICRIEFFEGGKSCGISSFTIQEAQIAELTSNATWKKFPRNMLYARALSNGARWYCSDIFGGQVYTHDELGVPVDGETGEVVEGQVLPTQTEPDDLVAPQTLAAIKDLWATHGNKQGNKITPLADYLHHKKQLDKPEHMTQEYAQKVLEWLQQKALATSTGAANYERKLDEQSDRLLTDDEGHAEKGSGLDQWRCTRESGSRQLAMDVLNATKWLEGTGVTADQWREELAKTFPEYESPISRKTLSADECRAWLTFINQWATKREAK